MATGTPEELRAQADRMRQVWAAVFYLLALAAQVSGYTNPAVAFALAAIATIIAIIPSCRHVGNWHCRRKDAGKVVVEPWHLTVAGLAGVVVFGAVALAGVIWQQIASPKESGPSPQSIAQTSAPGAPIPSVGKAILNATPPTLQKIPITAESLAVRQRALTQLNDFLAAVDEVVAEGDAIFMNPSAKARERLKQVQDYKNLVLKVYADQSRILARYNGIEDVFALAPQPEGWSILVLMEPMLTEYIKTIELVSPDSTINFGDHPLIARFDAAIYKLKNWLNATRGNIGNKRAEYDKTEVLRQ